MGKSEYLRYAEMADSLDYVIVIGGHNDAFKLDSIGGIDNFKDKMEILCKGLVEKYRQRKSFSLPAGTAKTLKEVTRKK